MEVSLSPQPVVKLEAVIRDPYDLAVATARTCYSSKGIIRVADVTKNERAMALRDKISQSTREAGHLTTRQHAHFVFSLDRVSRQFLWSFLHSHPFYNSEQVSQRYVKVEAGRFTLPPLAEKHRSIFESVVDSQMDDYRRLNEILFPKVREEYFKLFPIRARYLDRYEATLWKKCYEVGRYVLPVATQAYLYHTISALTLMRYHRLVNLYDTPWEQRFVVEKMVEAVCGVDPQFVRELKDPYELEETPEYAFFQQGYSQVSANQAFLREFDASLAGHRSVLLDYKANAPATLAAAVRSVLGVPREVLSDSQAIDQVLNPKLNPYLGDTLNVNTLSKLSRTLFHVHYTFRKKLSHTADSQDQRHRMVPGSRPVLEAHFTGQPDFIVPPLVQQLPEAYELYQSSMERTFAGIRRLIDEGCRREYALYLLPNAFPIRFEESGDLLHLHHKWHARACYTAQDEIFYATLQELQAVSQIHPELVRHILAPCYIRQEAGLRPVCPEGERFCGVKVWQKSLHEYERTL